MVSIIIYLSIFLLNAEERANAGAVKTILRNINLWVFCLCLSGCADIYDLFGVFANVCQDVDVLPYECFDKANAVITKFLKMMECIEHKHCPPDDPDNKKCLWPRYHEDLMLMEKDSKYMAAKVENVNMGSCRQTRLQSSSGELQVADGIGLVKERLTTLVWRLQNDLKSEVFDEDTKKMVEKVRTICDLKTLLESIKKKGSIVFGLQNSNKFLDAVRSITGTVKDVSDEDIVKTYRNFLKKIEKHFSHLPAKSLTSKDMVKSFLSKDKGLYKNIIIHCISVAAIKISVECSGKSCLF